MALRVFPVDRSGRPTFTDDFGAPRTGHEHQGTDIFAAAGTPVLAVNDGNARAELDPKGGQVIYLRTPAGHYYYAHLSAYEGTFPRAVRAGDVMGRVGTTGNAAGTSPHLHFEIHEGGVTLNPFPELTAARLLSSTPPLSDSPPWGGGGNAAPPAPAPSSPQASKSMAGALLAILILFSLTTRGNANG
jgi:murein DD-endopeptidase MepM/ murein hydrolase activator NlpD